MGVVIGSIEFRSESVTTKINKWIQDIEQLAVLAKDEPRLAYAGYTTALCMPTAVTKYEIMSSRSKLNTF